VLPTQDKQKRATHPEEKSGGEISGGKCPDTDTVNGYYLSISSMASCVKGCT